MKTGIYRVSDRCNDADVIIARMLSNNSEYRENSHERLSFGGTQPISFALFPVICYTWESYQYRSSFSMQTPIRILVVFALSCLSFSAFAEDGYIGEDL